MWNLNSDLTSDSMFFPYTRFSPHWLLNAKLCSGHCRYRNEVAFEDKKALRELRCKSVKWKGSFTELGK